ncbi:MAG: hypothetical protein RLZZ59_857 [Pseudomonadota bacterium]|jgi:hypothetical protein
MRIELKFSNLPNNQEVIWDQESNRINIQTIQTESGYDEGEIHDSSYQTLSYSSQTLMRILNDATVIESEYLEGGKFLKIILNTAIHEVFFLETATGKTLSFNSSEVLIHGSQVNINPREQKDLYEASESDYRAMVPLEHFFIEPKEEDSRAHDFSSHNSLNSSLIDFSRAHSIDLSNSFLHNSLPNFVDEELSDKINIAITNIKKLKISEAVYGSLLEDIRYLFGIDHAKFGEYLTQIQECKVVPQMMQLLETLKKEVKALYHTLESTGNPIRYIDFEQSEKAKLESLIEIVSDKLDPGPELTEIQELISNYARQGGAIDELSHALSDLTDPILIIDEINRHAEMVFTGAFYRFSLNDLEY